MVYKSFSLGKTFKIEFQRCTNRDERNNDLEAQDFT